MFKYGVSPYVVRKTMVFLYLNYHTVSACLYPWNPNTVHENLLLPSGNEVILAQSPDFSELPAFGAKDDMLMNLYQPDYKRNKTAYWKITTKCLSASSSTCCSLITFPFLFSSQLYYVTYSCDKPEYDLTKPEDCVVVWKCISYYSTVAF